MDQSDAPPSSWSGTGRLRQGIRGLTDEDLMERVTTIRIVILPIPSDDDAEPPEVALALDERVFNAEIRDDELYVYVAREWTREKSLKSEARSAERGGEASPRP